MSILKEIVEKTRITIDKRKESKSLNYLKSQVENLTVVRTFNINDSCVFE